jgi:radical SAM protein with 4Fe4S-binding SPASM domain
MVDIKQLKNLWYFLKERGPVYTYKYARYWPLYMNQNKRVVNWFYKKVPMPYYLEIEICTYCDLKCVECEHTYWKEPPRVMTLEQFKRVIDDIPSLLWVGFSGIGSNRLNKDFPAMLAYCRKKGMYTEFFDPFHAMTPELIKKVLDAKVDKIYASIDGATKETYEKVRIGAKFENVINNVKELRKQIKERKTKLPLVAFHYIINKINVHEMEKFLHLIHEIYPNCDHVTFTNNLHDYNEIKGINIKVTKDQFKNIVDLGKKLGIRVHLSLNTKKDEDKCPASECVAWAMPYIYVTGHVLPCCAIQEANQRDFLKEHSLGNVYEQSFKDIWYGERYTKLRNDLRAGKIPPVCRDCPVYKVK